MHLIKQLIILSISLFLTVLLLGLAVVFPAMVSIQLGNNNPPPPFDVGPEYGIHFTNPLYQIPNTLFLLSVPFIGSFIAYLLNGNKRNLTTYIPATLGYILFIAIVSYTYIRVIFKF